MYVHKCSAAMLVTQDSSTCYSALHATNRHTNNTQDRATGTTSLQRQAAGTRVPPSPPMQASPPCAQTRHTITLTHTHCPSISHTFTSHPAGDKVQQQPQVSEENLKVLEVQNPKLASEGIWAHATTQVEKGGLLLATPDNPLLLGTETYW